MKKNGKSYFDFLQVVEKLVLTKVAHTQNKAEKEQAEDQLKEAKKKARELKKELAALREPSVVPMAVPTMSFDCDPGIESC